MSLIIPCAGKSTRFPTRPKWLLTQPNGDIMLVDCIKNLNLKNINSIYITFLKEHISEYLDNDLTILSNILNKKYNKKIIFTLLEKSYSQSQTVYDTIKINNINGYIFVKDVDNSFNHLIDNTKNYICFLDCDGKNITRISSKSFIQFNDVNQLINISEKKMISNYICVSGYSFIDVNEFISAFEYLSNITNIKTDEIYISHIIYYLFNSKNIIFYCNEISNYYDWGTYDDWLKYNENFKTLFLDFDGVCVENGSRLFKNKWGNTKPLLKNIEHLQKLKNKGYYIIITTSRSHEFKQITLNEINKYNIPYDRIIFDLPHSQRILINDFSETSNPYPTAISVNLARNSSNLNQYLLL